MWCDKVVNILKLCQIFILNCIEFGKLIYLFLYDSLLYFTIIQFWNHWLITYKLLIHNCILIFLIRLQVTDVRFHYEVTFFPGAFVHRPAHKGSGASLGTLSRTSGSTLLQPQAGKKYNLYIQTVNGLCNLMPVYRICSISPLWVITECCLFVVRLLLHANFWKICFIA